VNWTRDPTRLDTQITRLAFVATSMAPRGILPQLFSSQHFSIGPLSQIVEVLPAPGRHERNRMLDLSIRADWRSL